MSLGSEEDYVSQFIGGSRYSSKPKSGRAESGDVGTLKIGGHGHCQSCMVLLHSLSVEFLTQYIEVCRGLVDRGSVHTNAIDWQQATVIIMTRACTSGG